MTPEQAINQHYGIRLPPLSEDGVFRSFKIDRFRNGFIIKFPGCAIFGSIIDAEYIVWDGFSYFSKTKEHKESKEIIHEWLIWEIARAAVENGQRLSLEDSERLSLAVRRLEAWL